MTRQTCLHALNMMDLNIFFNNYVSRDTELTFDGEQSKLVSKVDREAMRVSFEGAKRFYHTADSYMTDLEKTLAKYNLV